MKKIIFTRLKGMIPKKIDMKKLLFILAIVAASCSDKQAQEQVQTTTTEPSTASISEDIDAKAIEKIQTFYKNYVFGRQEATDSAIAQYCTQALAQKLRDDYDYEGEGYAIWKFRSGAPDGEDIEEIEKIESLGDNKYLIHYNDMGIKGTLTISVIVENNEILFDKIIGNEYNY